MEKKTIIPHKCKYCGGELYIIEKNHSDFSQSNYGYHKGEYYCGKCGITGKKTKE